MKPFETVYVTAAVFMVAVSALLLGAYLMTEPKKEAFNQPRNCGELVDELQSLSHVANATGRLPGNPTEYGHTNRFHVNSDICK